MLTIVRGLPGSGKSTFARMLAHATGAAHFEADMFFEVDGVYVWDGMRIGDAHAWCKRNVFETIDAGHPVVVSNTFTILRELRPYVFACKERGFVPTIITCQNSFGSVHGVPPETVTRMAARFTHDISPLFTEVLGEVEDAY
jgi:predicted ABC-type ATPase